MRDSLLSSENVECMRQEVADLRGALVDMSLPVNLTEEQFIKVCELIKECVTRPFWQTLVTNHCIEEEHAVVVNDPEEDGLMLLVVIWPGGVHGGVHNHLTWAAVGVIAGLEENQTWQLTSEPVDGHFIDLQKGPSKVLQPGDVCYMPADVIHSVNNLVPRDEVSVSIHVYGHDLRSTKRQLFHPDRQTFEPNPNLEFIPYEELL